jgi:hypothetical protein
VTKVFFYRALYYYALHRINAELSITCFCAPAVEIIPLLDCLVAASHILFGWGVKKSMLDMRVMPTATQQYLHPPALDCITAYTPTSQ